MRFPRPPGYLGELFDFAAGTFNAVSRKFWIFRVAFVLSLVPAAMLIATGLMLGPNTKLPWMGTALAIAVWLPIFVTMLLGVGALAGAFWLGEFDRLQPFAAMVAGSLVFAIATRMLPQQNWAADYLMLAALLLLAFAGGLDKLRWWAFIILCVEAALLFIPVVFPTGWHYLVNQGDQLVVKYAGKMGTPMKIDWNHPPAPFNPATGNGLFYYTQSPSGAYLIYNSPGHSKYTGRRLKRITSERLWNAIVAFMRAREGAGGSSGTRASSLGPIRSGATVAPARLADPEPLDITTYHRAMMLDLTPPQGLWYTRDPGGAYRFFSGRGLDPVTKKPDKLITAPIAEKIRKYFEQVHWPDGPHQIKIKSRYQALHLDFFPPGGLWCDRGGRFGYRLFDGPGVDPLTGRKLKRVTRPIAEQLHEAFASSDTVWPAH
jgi:hypothetical protein